MILLWLTLVEKSCDVELSYVGKPFYRTQILVEVYL